LASISLISLANRASQGARAEVRPGHGGVELGGAGGVRGGRGEISHLGVGLGAVGVERRGGGTRGNGLRVERGGEGEVVVEEGLRRLVLQLRGRRRRHGSGCGGEVGEALRQEMEHLTVG